MQILIIEDEEHTRNKIIDYVRRYNANWQIVGVQDSIAGALQFIQSAEKIDLILSDIELTDGNLMQAIEQFPLHIPIIFITAYNQYWQEAFAANSLHYLTKPFEYEQVASALRKFEQLQTKQQAPNQQVLLQLMQQFQQPVTYKTRLLTQQGSKFSIIETQSVLYFELEDGVIFAHLAQKKLMLKERSLQTLEAQLHPQHFFRINRHQLIQNQYIADFTRYDKNTFSIKMTNGERLKTSQGRTPAFREWVG